MASFRKTFDFNLRRNHQKNFLWASRLWVGRRKEPILGYVPKKDEKKNSGGKGLRWYTMHHRRCLKEWRFNCLQKMTLETLRYNFFFQNNFFFFFGFLGGGDRLGWWFVGGEGRKWGRAPWPCTRGGRAECGTREGGGKPLTGIDGSDRWMVLLCGVSPPRGAGGNAWLGSGISCPPPLSRQRKRQPAAEEPGSRRKKRRSRRPLWTPP